MACTEIKVIIVDAEREAAWDKMVEEHPLGSVFQHSSFKKVIENTFSHTKPYYLGLVDGEGEIRGGIPLFLVRSWLTKTRLVSLPFAFYSDPLVKSREEFEQLFQEVLKFYKEVGALYLEIKVRDSTDLLGSVKRLKSVFYHKTYWIDLTVGLDEIWKNLHKTSIRQRIRRSEKSGIIVRSAASEDDVLSFWRMLVETRKRLGVPPQNYSYFRNIWEYLRPLQLTDFLIAETNGQIIGGLNIFTFKDTLYGGHITSKKEYWPLGVNQALYWKALQIGINDGRKILDIGKTSPFAEGLIAYKKRWGAKELETPCFYYPCLKGVSSLNNEEKLTYKLMTFMWRNMPDWLLKIGGRFAYRHLG